MKKPWFYLLWFLTLCVIAFGLWRFSPPEPARKQEPANIPVAATNTPSASSISSSEPIQPLPLSIALDERKVSLGNKLFHDPKLSTNNTISCASCHDLKQAGADGRRLSLGVLGQLGDVNSPTVFNSGFNFKQFWDGRADTLEDQVDGPVTNPKEMDSKWPDVIQKLKQDPSYVSAFHAIYAQESIDPLMVQDAIATFERSLITPSRFDRYLRGDQAALSDREKAGYHLFKEHGCVVCHQGVNIGGNMFQSMGKMADYFADRGNVTESDLGRFNVTKDPRDRHKFKVPTLRNVALTAPYFHDGTVETLDAAVQTMAKYQLGISFSSEETALIVEFLHTLTGEYQGKSLAEQP